MKKILEFIYKKNPLQKKSIQKFLDKQDSLYWQRTNQFADKMISFLEKQGLTIEYVADSYLAMCKNMLIEQIKFKKTGKYTCQNASVAHADIYSSEKEMSSYMYGLSLSQFLWPNHYAMYDFFIRESKELTGVNSYLEIGPGHGLYLVEAIMDFSNAKFLAIDISPISKRISESIVKHFTGSSKCEFQIKDAYDLEGGKFDYIVMGEVLEHLGNPKSLLKKINRLLNDNGRLFVTTCANCPAIDHVYLYDSVEHIRQEIRESGFAIIADLPLAVGDYAESEWDEQRIEINYAAMLKRV
ncbi:methyltransferase domain-containing protein [Thermodesulfobacteriota bacterium]